MPITVKTPRFYVNVVEWLMTVGLEATDSRYFTLPVTPSHYLDVGSSHNVPVYGLLGDNSFQMILGHNLANTDSVLTFNDINGQAFSDLVEINNAYLYGGGGRIDFNGWSLQTANCGQSDYVQIYLDAVEGASINAGSMIIGTFYDMPSPTNLSLTSSIQAEGTKELLSHNGSSYSNSISEAPLWGELGAWELHDPTLTDTSLINQVISRKSRRSWKLSFSYMDDGDLWGLNQSLHPASLMNEVSGMDFDDGDIYHHPVIDQTAFSDNLLTDDNFFSQVWHKTLGGSIPMIMQIDKDNNNPDQFAIVRLASDSLKATQVASSLYNITLTVEETF